MNNIVPFSFESQQVRVIDKDDNPWFVAADVCAVLGLGNTSQAMSRLDDDERSTIILNDGTDGNPNQTIISESGMYALVLTSRKPQAKPFRKWVTGEVLPSIRKTGQYQTKTAIKAAYQKGRQDAQQLLPEWQENRTTGKVMRHELTDTIKAFIEYAKAQGSRGADKYYMNITKMLNEAVLGTHASNNPHFRDTLDAGQLMLLANAEKLAGQLLREAMQAALPYKACFQAAKAEVIKLVKLMKRIGTAPLLGGPANTQANLPLAV